VACRRQVWLFRLGGTGAVTFTLNPMNQSTELHWIDCMIILIYFGFVLGIGLILRRFIPSRRSISTGPQTRLTQQY
jgi:hypothetical protein